MPKRVQMRRDRPWRKDHPEAVIVARPSRWGNPFKLAGWQGAFQALQAGCRGDAAGRREAAVRLFDLWLTAERKAINRPLDVMDEALAHKVPSPPTEEAIKTELRGKDLACWCPLDQPCHADVLLRLANES